MSRVEFGDEDNERCCCYQGARGWLFSRLETSSRDGLGLVTIAFQEQCLLLAW